MLIGIRDGDPALEATTGVTYHPQDENGGGNVAFYEINNTADEINFDLRDYIGGLDTPILVLRSLFGETDFDLEDQTTGEVIVSEQSGFDSDTWFINVDETSGQFTLTEFDTDAGVDGTQAGWYAYVELVDLEA